MSKEKLGQDKAFPRPYGWNGRNGAASDYSWEAEGMSKRFYAACAALQGLLSNQHIYPNGIMSTKEKTKLIYEYVDELLKQENE